ncbi:hypothetical protein EZS27_022380 [termite gut metagenome]|uniref:Uncharacterized protein n=1 Tax=termite gut metagenome TaxID=433724 RepID=A0A5J4R5A4_9ZZZZ
MSKEINPVCIKKKKDPVISLKERKSEFRFNNPERKEITCVQVDGCAIRDDGIRCDWMIISSDVEHYIELKGCDVKHAIEQLKRSIQLLSNNPAKGIKFAFVVSTRCPLSGTDVQKMQWMFKKKFNADLSIKNSPCIFPPSPNNK